KDNILMEANDRNAIEVYAEILKKTVDDVKRNILNYGMNYPIGILGPDVNYLIVSPFAIANDKYIRCAAFLNKGMTIDIVQASKQKMLKATRLISDINKRKTQNSVALSLCFSCSMRKIKLGNDYIKESMIATGELKSNTLVGIYGYAEYITPEDGQARMVNETFTSITFSNKLIND
ncbi:MAG: FIST C-terminal domain-containing protein, partial [Nanoarchaeota archaeon]